VQVHLSTLLVGGITERSKIQAKAQILRLNNVNFKMIFTSFKRMKQNTYNL
jgi:hypothetical protein